MKLPDSKPDSILIYTDWLIDNNQEELALEIREEAAINQWHFEYNKSNKYLGGTISKVGTEYNSVRSLCASIVGTQHWAHNVGGDGLW